MKVNLKVDEQWLDLEKKSFEKMRHDYRRWEAQTLQQARGATDLRSLREIFYQMGDRWEWDQTTGSWLSSGMPLDAVGLVLRMPGLDDRKERYAVYAIMAYSKGVTSQFDHLGDKERIIVERDTETGEIRGWSTTGHGSMDLFPTDLTQFQTLEGILSSCSLVAQPGDHALRLELPKESPSFWLLAQLIWSMANGFRLYSTRSVEVMEQVEESLGFHFDRYAKAVIDLERAWIRLKGGVVAHAKESVLDRVPDDVEKRDTDMLRRTEGLLHALWFTPPARMMQHVLELHHELSSDYAPSDVQRELLVALEAVSRSLSEIVERAKYIKWKSVMDKTEFGKSDLFAGLEISGFAKDALAVSLEDILKDHSLAYVGYPERLTMKGKTMRVLLGLTVLPLRLAKAFYNTVDEKAAKLAARFASRFKRIHAKPGEGESR